MRPFLLLGKVTKIIDLYTPLEYNTINKRITKKKNRRENSNWKEILTSLRKTWSRRYYPIAHTRVKPNIKVIAG